MVNATCPRTPRPGRRSGGSLLVALALLVTGLPLAVVLPAGPAAAAAAPGAAVSAVPPGAVATAHEIVLQTPQADADGTPVESVEIEQPDGSWLPARTFTSGAYVPIAGTGFVNATGTDAGTDEGATIRFRTEFALPDDAQDIRIDGEVLADDDVAVRLSDGELAFGEGLVSFTGRPRKIQTRDQEIFSRGALNSIYFDVVNTYGGAYALDFALTIRWVTTEPGAIATGVDLDLVTPFAPDGEEVARVEALQPDGNSWAPARAYNHPLYDPLTWTGFVNETGTEIAQPSLHARLPFSLPASAQHVRLDGEVLADDFATVTLAGATLAMQDPLADNWQGRATPFSAEDQGSFVLGEGDTHLLLDVQNARGGPLAVDVRARVHYTLVEPAPTGSGPGEAGPANASWPGALSISAPVTASIDRIGEALWYRFPVTPDATVTADLTQLGADYDLTLFRDIGAAFHEVTSPRDLSLLSAEFAADAFSPSAFSPSAFSPSAFSPSAFSPSAFSPSAFSPSAFSPSAFSPSAFSPSAFSPSAFSPSAFSPSAFSPDTPLSEVIDPHGLTLGELADAFSSAQTRSLIAVSAHDGLLDEHLKASTWDASGSFYVRVQGRNGAFAPGAPFTLSVTQTGGACGEPLQAPAHDPLPGVRGTARTVVLTDLARLPGTDQERAALRAQLAAFVARPEVGGVVVDASQSAALRELNAQADRLVDCPYAKNLVAQELRALVNDHRDDAGTLRYVVVVGDDDVIPFFRSADAAGLGPEQNYVPPVSDGTGSQASLRRNQVLSQDAYGARSSVTLKGATVPVQDAAVGRLVETPAEISAALSRYTDLNGTLPQPKSMLVTGYDFLTDGADELSRHWRAGLGASDPSRDVRTSQPVAELITDGDVPPSVTTVGGQPDRRHSWTTDDLKAALLGQRRDLVYLAGHFSANSALAADYRTSLLTTDVRDSTADLTDTLVLSAGCHSGYNIVDRHGVPGVTLGLDWAQAMAQKGATLVAGTGYQYGDTDFIEYSERLYADMAGELRVGTGAVALGDALLKAKQRYLATTPVLSGIHQKALLEATLYGLPMLGLDLPTGRTPVEVFTPAQAEPVLDGPGAVLDLEVGSVTAEGGSTLTTQPFTTPATADAPAGSGEFTYAVGADGVTTSPGQPALPLEVEEVSVDGKALRGVGFRGGRYDDLAGIVPLAGAPATETAEVHTSFSSPVFFPRRLAVVNHFGAIEGDGQTRLLVTPAQHRSDGATTSTLRRYSSVDLQLLYSGNTTTYANGSTPALAAPPSISGVSSTPVAAGTTRISARVVGDPSAGIQQVWVTRTAESGPWYGAWSSVDLVQDPADSSLWSAELAVPADQDSAEVRYLVQAANGVGLVSLQDDGGREYRLGSSPGLDPEPQGRSLVDLQLTAPDSAVYGDTATAAAVLLDAAGGAVAGQPVELSIGASRRTVLTDGTGRAEARLTVADPLGTVPVTATFAGDESRTAASASRDLEVLRRPTLLTAIAGVEVLSGQSSPPLVTLTSRSVPLFERTLGFVVRDAAGQVVAQSVATTDQLGQAGPGRLTLPAGRYGVTASYGATPGAPSTSVTDAQDAAATPVTVELVVRSGAATLDPLRSPFSESGAAKVKAGSSVPVKLQVVDGAPISDDSAHALADRCGVVLRLSSGTAPKTRCLRYSAADQQFVLILSLKETGWKKGSTHTVFVDLLDASGAVQSTRSAVVQVT